MHIKKFGIPVFAAIVIGGALLGAGSVAGQGVVSATRSTVAALPGQVPADNSSVAVIEVTLNDDAGHPVAGKAVSLRQSAGTSATGQPASTVSANTSAVILAPTEAITNSMGIAAFSVKDAVVETVTFSAMDATDNVAIAQTAQVTFTAKPVQALSVGLAVIPNGSYVAGLNMATVFGGGSVADAVAQVQASSGMSVQAVWMLSGGMWWYYIPAFPGLSGGVSAFPCSFACTPNPPASAFFVLA